MSDRWTVTKGFDRPNDIVRVGQDSEGGKRERYRKDQLDSSC
jgi:hypothetical protein